MNEYLTDEELNRELKYRSQMKDIYILPNHREFGVENLQIFVDNFKSIVDHAKKARENGCYIEYITLLSSWIEFYLKMYCFGKRFKNCGSFNKLTLGRLLTLIRKNDNCFDVKLLSMLKDFLDLRNDVTHNLLFGKIDFESIEEQCDRFTSLGNEVMEYVIRSIGIPYANSKINGKKGGAIIELTKK